MEYMTATQRNNADNPAREGLRPQSNTCNGGELADTLDYPNIYPCIPSAVVREINAVSTGVVAPRRIPIKIKPDKPEGFLTVASSSVTRYIP